MSIKAEATIEDLYRLPENSKEVIRVYRASNPEQPQVYRRGEVAEAEESAVPEWFMPVDDLFV